MLRVKVNVEKETIYILPLMPVLFINKSLILIYSDAFALLSRNQVQAATLMGQVYLIATGKCSLESPKLEDCHIFFHLFHFL